MDKNKLRFVYKTKKININDKLKKIKKEVMPLVTKNSELKNIESQELFDIDLALAISLSETFNIKKNESKNLVKNNLLDKIIDDEEKTTIDNFDKDVREQIQKLGGNKILENEGGGNCLFHSLSEHLKIDHKQLRDDSVSFIISSWERFKNFALNPSTLNPFKSSDEYKEYMSRDGSWGDHLSLLALCELYQVNAILVITEGKKLSEPLLINVGSNVNILIRFNSEFHYEAIV